MQGYIKLQRKIQEHWIYQEKRKFSKYEAWLDMLMMANHKPNKFVHGNELVEVDKGEFITSELKLMERWDWGKNKLRLYLDLLEKDGMIVKKSDRKKTSITICNYCIYHHYETESGPQADQDQTASGPQTDTNKNVKNDKNDKEENILSAFDIAFESFWTLYPKKKDKKPAKEKFKAAIKKHDIQVVMDGTRDYAKECEIKGREQKYIKNAATFLNQESYLNEFDHTPERGKPNGTDKAAEQFKIENGIPF